MKRICVALAFALAGCASVGGNLQREAALAIGGNLAPEEVSVANVDRGITQVKWEAVTPKGRYSCSADDMMRRTLCVKK